MNLKTDLSEQNILVTGASKGIGASLVQHLMQAGARTGVHYRSGSKEAFRLIDQFDRNGSKTFQADLSSLEETRQLFEAVIENFERLDTLVINAGIFEPHAVSMNTDQWLEVWQKTLDVNLNAAGLLTKLAIEHFRTQGGGRIIYVGSRAAFRGETREYLAYAASKGGLTSLARTVARSFGKEGIKAFVIAPGFTRTQMAESFIESHGEERVLSEISLTELTRPEDLAPLFLLLCSGLMDHATGTTIDVNAGSYIH
ncbi:SDR family NAD(P)-dependent oxidoreductase [Aureitalea marina]|uniref:NAD-dependent dehydratase n=1 Tax=Aureitalea marina TaxID=930804 RepID=A0A2S7KPA1_9FLAO|nr:SDR family oxidoreductase [Aureitalea marina]PQB04408.1 NAD-dependent dehydratase [Aureitalea marina]